MTFEGKVVAITGAAGGVGLSLCRYFIDEGAKVAAIDRKASVETLASDLKAPAKAFFSVVADISETAQVDRAFASLAGALGPVDVLVNNAGGSAYRSFARTDPAGWRHDIDGNLNSAYDCAHAVIPGMVAKRSGVIIGIGSVNGLSALGDPAYSAAKAAMISLTRSSGSGIRSLWRPRQYRLAGHRAHAALGGARRQEPEGPGDAAALVSARTHRRA